MKAACKQFDKIDKCITKWMGKHGVEYLRWSLAIVFIWFGILKPLGISPAASLVAKTVYWFDPSFVIPFLGWWEVAIGLCLLYKPMIRVGIFLMGLQMVGTFLPLILLPGVTWQAPFVLTMEGQYIVKNLVLISAALVVGSKVRKNGKSWISPFTY
ncbi:MAG: hypothetical protein ACE5FT_06100 [Candidatus Nanoarchaeia archaeon]